MNNKEIHNGNLIQEVKDKSEDMEDKEVIVDNQHNFTKWTKEQILVSSTWTSIRPLTQSPTSFLPLHWRDRSLMDRLLDG